MKDEELKRIKGGIVTKLAMGKYGILGGVIVFLIGVVDVFINPSKCNN